MASHDVRDVLNLPTDGAGSRPTKKQRIAAPRPNLKGLAREVQNLGGDNPIAIVPDISSFKKRRFASRKPAAKWEMRPFRNSARDDPSLILGHWRRKDEKPQSVEQANGQNGDEQMDVDKKPEDMEDSSFAKFNVKVHIPEYNDDQYNSSLTNDKWSKEETDYLLGLVRDFDLRWELIWDRYKWDITVENLTVEDFPPGPTLEELRAADPKAYETAPAESTTEEEAKAAEAAIIATLEAERQAIIEGLKIEQAKKGRSITALKRRYYEVAARMMAVTKPVQYMNADEFALHKVMTTFDAVAESRRKRFAENQLSRSKEEAREEESLLVEVKRIMARQEKFNSERRELYNRLDYPHSDATQDLSAFKTSTGLQTLLQNLMSVDKSKKRKSIMGTDGQNTPASAGPSAQPGSTPVADPRRESVALSTTSGHRDSISAADGRPDKPTKKGTASQPQERRKLTEQEEQIYGVTTTAERLSSGPTFRYERINKILTTKSNAQHQRITNTLTELDVPGRLNMPTRDVVEQMERLLANVQTLLDLRKISDKLDGELKLEQAKKAEREKLNGNAQSESKSAEGSSNSDGANAAQATDAAATTGAGAIGTSSSADNANVPQPVSSTGAATQSEAMHVDKSEEKAAEVKLEAADDKASRPTSSGGRKRSASVMSTASNQSAKRQKK